MMALGVKLTKVGDIDEFCDFNKSCRDIKVLPRGKSIIKRKFPFAKRRNSLPYGGEWGWEIDVNQGVNGRT